MVLTERVRPRVAGLGLAAADMAAGGAHAEAIVGAALLATIAAGRSDLGRGMCAQDRVHGR